MKRIILLLLLMICVSVFSILYPAISTIQGGGTNDDPPLYSTTKQLGDGGKEVKVYYDADKTLKRSVKYLNQQDQVHREIGPAITTWHGNGQLESRAWYINGSLKKSIAWDPEGNKIQAPPPLGSSSSRNGPYTGATTNPSLTPLGSSSSRNGPYTGLRPAPASHH